MSTTTDTIPQPAAEPEPSSQKRRSRLGAFLKVLGWSVTPCIALFVLVFGQGIFLKPKIIVSCGAIDFRIPDRFKLELLATKMGLLAPQLAQEATNAIRRDLLELGVAADRIESILNGTNGPEPTARECALVARSMNKAVLAFQDEHLRKALVIPDAAMFFEVGNEGRRSAKDAHLVIRIDGQVYQTVFDSDNKWRAGTGDEGQLVYEIDSLAPKSRTKGIVWYSHGTSKTTMFTNEVTLSSDAGTVLRTFTEDNFNWGK